MEAVWKKKSSEGGLGSDVIVGGRGGIVKAVVELSKWGICDWKSQIQVSSLLP